MYIIYNQFIQFESLFIFTVLPYQKPDVFGFVTLVSFAILFLLAIALTLYLTIRKHLGPKKQFFIVLPLFPLFFIVVFGGLLSDWGGAIISSLGSLIIAPLYFFAMLRFGRKMAPKIHEDMMKRIHDGVSKGFTPKSMQENGRLPGNKWLIRYYGFTEEELKEFGLIESI